MRKFITRVQNLGQKAAQIQQAIQSVPPKIAEVRQAVAMTTGQLQQLRSDIRAGAADLRADSEGSLLQALQEVNGATQVFEQAGYELAGVDMELSPNQRLIVHLSRFEQVDSSTLQSLLRANQHAKTIHGILWSLIRAEEMAAQVDVANMIYRELIVHVGPIPSVRMGWGYEEDEETVASPPAVPSIQTTIVPPPPPAGSGSFPQTTFFESRSVPQPAGSAAVANVAATPDISAVSTAAVPTASQVESTEAASADWRRAALDRLKKSPHVSKYQRRF
jgi:hypothetical protein